MFRPLVTVLLDTYNHERFIEEAIVSVLEQDFSQSEMEVIAVDDGSTDSTPEIIRKFAPRVRHLRKANGGQASAFNAGIPEAKGQTVAFLDGDDWWERNKLERVMNAMAADPSVGIVGHGIIIHHRDGREQLEILRGEFRFRANTIEGARLFCRRGSFLGTSRMTIRADALREIGPVPEGIAVQADEYLFTLASAFVGAEILPEPLTHYRMHDANGFQFSGYDPSRIRHKQKSLAELAKRVSEKLIRPEIQPDARGLIIGMIQASADRLRLMLDGGWPWETAKTEWKIYCVTHPDAAYSHRALKLLALASALATPPKSYYSVQRKLGRSKFYRNARKRWLPFPEMTHLQKDWRVR